MTVEIEGKRYTGFYTARSGVVTVRVRLATDSRCICWFGYVCEDHPDKPWEHDDCHAARDPCTRPDFPIEIYDL